MEKPPSTSAGITNKSVNEADGTTPPPQVHSLLDMTMRQSAIARSIDAEFGQGGAAGELSIEIPTAIRTQCVRQLRLFKVCVEFRVVRPQAKASIGRFSFTDRPRVRGRFVGRLGRHLACHAASVHVPIDAVGLVDARMAAVRGSMRRAGAVATGGDRRPGVQGRGQRRAGRHGATR